MMKSVLIWLIFVVAGAFLGYVVSFLAELNVYISVGVAVIIGSSSGITYNIHKERDNYFYNDKTHSDPENQKIDSGVAEKMTQKSAK